MLHDGHLFGLFEAMSAIEMMDPKMDAGMLCNRGNPKPLNFQQAVDVSVSDYYIDFLLPAFSATPNWLVENAVGIKSPNASNAHDV